MTTLLLITLSIAWVDDKPSDAQEKLWRAEIGKIAAAKARNVEVSVGATGVKAELRETPLLSWSNPTVGNVYGEVYLWSHRGRPVAIGSIYRWYYPISEPPTIEFTSTADLQLRGRDGTNPIWRTQESGATFRSAAETPAAGDTPATRLRQMRALAGRFAVTLVDDRDTADVKRKLRLLTQPVHRYSSEKDDILDGAVFAFVEGTDPEAWLLVEAGKKKAWHYGLARMNTGAADVSLDGEVVQRFEKLEDGGKKDNGAYRLFKFAEP